MKNNNKTYILAYSNGNCQETSLQSKCKKEVTSKFDLIFTKLSSLYMYICYHTQNSMFTKGGSRNGGGGFESYLPTLLPTYRFILQILTDRSFQLCNIRK